MKRRISLLNYNMEVIGEALLSELNRWGTGEVIRHDPKPNDSVDREALIMHFIDCGGLDDVNSKYEIEITP